VKNPTLCKGGLEWATSDQIDKFTYEYTKKHRVTQGATIIVASLGAGAIVMLTNPRVTGCISIFTSETLLRQ